MNNAEFDNSSAIFNIGYCYEKEIGVEKDPYKAFYNFKRSVHLGYEKGKSNVEYYMKHKIEDRGLQYWLEDAFKDEHIRNIDYSEFSPQTYISNGAFGIVYKSEWKDCRKSVAHKCLFKGCLTDEDYKDFVKELKFLRKVDCHPNIIKFYGVTQDKNGMYNLVLEYANDGTLREYLKKNIKWNDRLKMSREIAFGLSYLHGRRIIHRDLHSKNILICEGQPKISDFGLSKNMNDITSNTNGQGLPAYLEPQSLKNPKYKRDKKSDIYSFGVIMWEISSGTVPFKDDDYFNIALKIVNGERETPAINTPPQYSKLYKICWEADPEERPEISSVLNSLNEMCNGIN
ncbi:kinase-like protein [Gigaspora margarita]|uniref:Kinase-like protein n=1 Tax=Gigaspora margarita TaxID=4874 RepID=A0A8H4EPW6_GIGMA|nr:kinase-like protein [Gigaspora margarita]